MDKIHQYIDTLSVETNEYNGGLCAFFEWKGQQYYADLCIVPFANYSECMIFPAKDEQVTNWGEVYCKRNIPINEMTLKNCIKNFIISLTKNDGENN